MREIAKKLIKAGHADLAKEVLRTEVLRKEAVAGSLSTKLADIKKTGGDLNDKINKFIVELENSIFEKFKESGVKKVKVSKGGSIQGPILDVQIYGDGSNVGIEALSVTLDKELTDFLKKETNTDWLHGELRFKFFD